MYNLYASVLARPWPVFPFFLFANSDSLNKACGRELTCSVYPWFFKKQHRAVCVFTFSFSLFDFAFLLGRL